MPYYIFYCQACDKEFTQMLHISLCASSGLWRMNWRRGRPSRRLSLWTKSLTIRSPLSG